MKQIRIKLDKLFKEKKVTRYYVSKEIGVRYQVLDNYYKNKVVRYDSDMMLRICVLLNCGIEDIIEIYETETVV